MVSAGQTPAFFIVLVPRPTICGAIMANQSQPQGFISQEADGEVRFTQSAPCMSSTLFGRCLSANIRPANPFHPIRYLGINSPRSSAAFRIGSVRNAQITARPTLLCEPTTPARGSKPNASDIALRALFSTSLFEEGVFPMTRPSSTVNLAADLTRLRHHSSLSPIRQVIANVLSAYSGLCFS